MTGCTIPQTWGPSLLREVSMLQAQSSNWVRGGLLAVTFALNLDSPHVASEYVRQAYTAVPFLIALVQPHIMGQSQAHVGWHFQIPF